MLRFEDSGLISGRWVSIVDDEVLYRVMQDHSSFLAKISNELNRKCVYVFVCSVIEADSIDISCLRLCLVCVDGNWVWTWIYCARCRLLSRIWLKQYTFLYDCVVARRWGELILRQGYEHGLERLDIILNYIAIHLWCIFYSCMLSRTRELDCYWFYYGCYLAVILQANI